jgi:GR25 family glycosyltransferase involved in LPS biosynthesis
VSKLYSFPNAYIINLPTATIAREKISKSFRSYNLNNFTFVDGVDRETVYDYLIGKTFNAGHTNKESSPSQIAVMMAHINAIEKWLSSSDTEYAIIMEDDASFETVKNWNWSWKEFFDKLPTDFDIVQLALLKIEPKEYSRIRFEHRIVRSDYASAAAYLISRSYGIELIQRHKMGDKFVFPATHINSVADEILYDTQRAYTCPLFIFNDLDLEDRQTVKEHKDSLHFASYTQIINLWKNYPGITLEEMFGE